MDTTIRPLNREIRGETYLGTTWLLGLPLQFWSNDVSRWNGDDLGIYLDHDISYIESRNITIAKIIVHLDTRERLV